MPATAAAPIPRDRIAALVVLCTAALMAILDDTVVNVALPSIQRDLGFATSTLSWVLNAYLVAFGGLLLLAGRIGDLVGRRRVLLTGLSLFSAASALCGAAPAAAWLVAARFLQGAGAALASSVALGMVVALFADPLVRARAIGIYSFVGAVGASAGLLVGGLLTGLAGWRWAFYINVPIGLAAVLLGRRALAAESGPGLRAGADAPGAVLLVSGLMLALVAIVAPAARWLGAPAAGLLILFALRLATARRPLIPRSLLRSRVVVGANLAHALLVGAMFGFQFLITLYLQDVLGYSPARTGLAILPIAGGIGAISLLVFPRLSRRWPPALLLRPGLLAIAAGMALLTRVPADGRYLTDLAPSMGLFALGGGLTLPSIMAVAMSGAAPEAAGAASGLINTAQQVGGAVGLAALAAIAAGHHDLTAGFHAAWTAGTALVLAALATVLVALSPRRAARQDATASQRA
jgi:EmrB/QacA subfamily drug resistance transporter